MSFIKCIQGKVDAGLIKKSQGRSLQEKFDNLSRQYSLTMSDEQAATQAATNIVNV